MNQEASSQAALCRLVLILNENPKSASTQASVMSVRLGAGYGKNHPTFHQNDGDDRAGQRDMKKKFAAAGQQTLQPRIVTTKMKTRDVVRDCLGGYGQWQSEKTNKSDGGEGEAAFAGFAAELRLMMI